MKLVAGLSFLAGAQAAIDAQATDVNVYKTRGTRLFFNWEVSGSDNVDTWDVIVTDDEGAQAGSVKFDKKNDNSINIDRLKSHRKYDVTLIPRSGSDVGTPTTFSAWTSPQPVQNVITVARYATTVWIEWQPADTRKGEIPDQYVVTNADDDSERYFTSDTNLQIVLGKGVSRKYIIQAAACDDCENAFNDAWSKPLEFDVTSLPPKPTGLNIVEENIRDWERADVLLAWDSPNFEYDSVKVEYSPNTPQGFTRSPSFFPGPWNTQTTIEGLYQNVVYTVSARFVLNDVEGPSESISVAIADADSKFPKQQNCQVPTYLRPENLRVKRDIFGSTSMTVSWDHPRAKKPENGYRLVFAPFTPISSQKPWFQDIDGNTNEFEVSGPSYDPYDEYTVSVIALHDEQLSAPQSPDFISSTFTGTKLQNERNTEFIAPDACCGNHKYNSKMQECCGGNLFDSDNINMACCGSSTYSPATEKCCPGGVLVASSGQC